MKGGAYVVAACIKLGEAAAALLPYT